MEKLIPSFIIISAACAISLSCKSSNTAVQKAKDMYEIVELENYKEDALFFQTIPYDSIYGRQLSYEGINDYNYKINWVLENDKFVDFDTIFNMAQRQQIDGKFQARQKMKLQKSKLKDPSIISKTQTGWTDGHNKGYAKVTFPFVQKARDGSLFAFILRSWARGHSGEITLIIYKFEENKWVEFAKVPYGIS